jgi:hypothetical protein
MADFLSPSEERPGVGKSTLPSSRPSQFRRVNGLSEVLSMAFWAAQKHFLGVSDFERRPPQKVGSLQFPTSDMGFRAIQVRRLILEMSSTFGPVHACTSFGVS